MTSKPPTIRDRIIIVVLKPVNAALSALNRWLRSKR